ncbi:UNVERIFIED_CONTAM: hypothetical protein K2H54_030859 [Gekko kuhli]
MFIPVMAFKQSIGSIFNRLLWDLLTWPFHMALEEEMQNPVNCFRYVLLLFNSLDTTGAVTVPFVTAHKLLIES